MKRMTVEEFKTAAAYTKAADLIHALELAAEERGVALALNDATYYLRECAAKKLDEYATAPTPEDAEAAQSDPTSPRSSTPKLPRRLSEGRSNLSP